MGQTVSESGLIMIVSTFGLTDHVRKYIYLNFSCKIKLRKLNLIFVFLMLALGSMYITTYQNVSAVADEIISHTIKINENTVNGPVLNNGDLFGQSIANIGDLNGDGVLDIAVGAYGDDTGGYNSGAAHIILLNSDGTVSDTIVIDNNTANGPVLNSNDRFGQSIANIGDLNGDGVLDIAAGATGDDTDSGAVHIILLNSDGTVSDTIVIDNNTANGPVLNDYDKFGYSIANIGDLNGDGVLDIAAGATGDDTDSGAVHIILLNSDGTVSRTIKIDNNTANGPVLNDYDKFGYSIANIGDLNNDGISDIIVGAPYDDINGENRGAVHIMLLNSDGTVSDTIEINDNTPNGPNLLIDDLFGISIANIGDLNNDGISDIAVDTGYDFSGDVSRGSTRIMFMDNNVTVSYTIKIDSTTTNGPVLHALDEFGYSIANIGDLNNDGVTDIAVGARNDGADGLSKGAIHIMFMDNSALLPALITNITSDGTTGTLKIGDTITFTLTTNSTDNGITVNGAYNSVPLSWSSTDNGTKYTAIYTVSEGAVDQTTPLQITDVTIRNSIGINTSQPFDGTDVLATIDANSPKFTRAETISTSQIGIILDENVVDNTASPNDFTLGGVDGGSIGSIAYVTNNIIGLDIVGATILDTDSVTLSYTRTSGSFDDASGNSLLNFAEDVINTIDNTPPVITLNGANPHTIELGDGYTELGATTNDGSQVTINSDGFRDVVGAYSIYYDSTDTSGNDATQVIRIVHVVDTQPVTSANLLNNPYSLSSWTIHTNGGNGWLDSSSGKKNWIPSEQAFATSYWWAEKSQIVPITSTDGTLILTEDYSKTYCGEKKGWQKNYPPYDRYYLAMLLLDSSGNEIERHVTGQIKMKDSCDWGRNWHTAKIVVDSIPDDTVSVQVKHGGISGERWHGWYGPVMKDIKLVYQN